MIKFANRFFLLFLITLTLLSAEEKKKALVEYAGSTQCPYCPQVTVLLDRYLDPSHPDYFGKDIVDKMVVVRYHTYNPGYGDPMYATIGGASCEADFTCVRINGEVSKEWYQISGVPSVFIDGTKTNNYLGDVKTTQAETTPVKISLEGSTFNDLTVNAKVTITSETDLSAEPLYLFVMATMDSVHYVGANGETEHEQVFLGFMGDTGPGLGKAITLSNTQAIEWTHTWTLPSDYPNEANGRDLGLISDWNTTVWDKKNMNLVAFVQNKTTLEVVQTEMISRRTMPVSQSPVVTAIADITIDEDNSKTLDIIATDPDGDAITYSALSDTNAVTTSISASTLTLTPKANWNGVATITAYASDGTHKDSTTFKLTVTPVNDIAAIADVTIDEDKSAEVALTTTFTGTTTFTAVSVSDSVTASISASTLTLTPKANWNGVATITAYASDGTHKDSTTFKLTVTPVNDIAAIADVTIDEDKSAEVALTTTFTGTTTFTAVSVSDSVTASISASTLTLTPNANWNGATNITAYASNSTFKDSTTFTLTVNPIPDLPGEFTWTNSTSEIDSITITSSNMSFEWNIGWDKSIDPDGEDVTYKIFNTNPPFNMVPVDLFELSFTQTTIDFPYETFILRWPSTLQMVNRLTYKYNVYAYSGNDSTEITGSRVLVVKRVGDLNTESIEPPNAFVLHPNYPNPFNPQTQIRFEMPYAGKIDLSIYNLLGVKIKTLYSGQKPSGVFTFKWDAKNDNNQLVSGGVYIYKLQSEKDVQMRKMILLK